MNLEPSLVYLSGRTWGVLNNSKFGSSVVGLSPGWAAPALLSLAASQASGSGPAMGSRSGEHQPAHASSLLLLQPVGKSRNTEMG